MDSIDAGLLEEATSIIKDLNKALDRFELTQLLSGPYDKEGAVVFITAGAGGTDAQVRSYCVCKAMVKKENCSSSLWSDGNILFKKSFSHFWKF